MQIKRVTALLVALGLTISMLTGCGKTEEANNTQVEESVESVESDDKEEVEVEDKGITFPLEEPITLTVAALTNNEYILEDSLAMRRMEEMTNVHVEFTYMPVSEAEKRTILLNSGDYPDVFLKCHMEEEHFATGAIIPLEDMVREYAPNYSALMDKYDAWDKTTAADGHTYTLAQIQPNSYMNPILYINETWLENIGMKTPTNLEEFYNVLKAFKEQDANGNGDPDDEIPFLTCSDFDKLWNFAQCIGINRQSHDSNEWALDNENDEIYYWPASEKGKEMAAFLEKLYDEGLLYNDTFVSSHEQTDALGSSAPIAGCVLQWAAYEMVGRTEEGGYGNDFDALNPLEGLLPVSSGIAAGTFAITDACEYPEIALAWIDYLYSEEGAIAAWMGEEGVTYEVKGDGSWAYITDGEYGEDPYASATIQQGGGVNLPVLIPDRYIYEKYIDPTNIVETKKVAAKQRILENYVYDAPFPTITLTEEENDTYSTVNADLKPYWKQYYAEVITGKKDLDATWDEFVAEMEEMGLTEIVDIYNAAYDRVK